jgi:hypothetical protein
MLARHARANAGPAQRERGGMRASADAGEVLQRKMFEEAERARITKLERDATAFDRSIQRSSGEAGT